MRNNAYKDLDALVRVFAALSDETRLRIMGLLMVRECCVCEVMQALGISQTRASRNLGILAGAGLVRHRRDGRWILYRIEHEDLERRMPGLLVLLSAVLGKETIVVEDRKRLKKSVRVGPDCGGGLVFGKFSMAGSP